MDEAEHVAMVLPGGECSAKRGRSQQPANEGTEGKTRVLSVACVSVWRRGSPISQTHSRTSSNKTLQACMHLSKCTHTHTHTQFTHAHFPFSRIKSRRFQRWCSWIIYGCPSAGQAIIKLRPRLICSLMRLAFSSGSWANIKYILFLQIWLPFYCYCY